MFPLSERNQFLIYMNMPDGTDISQTETRALEIFQMAGDPAQIPRSRARSFIGDGGPRFYLTSDARSGRIRHRRSFWSTRRTIRAQSAPPTALGNILYENHPEARFKIKRLAMGSVESGLVDVEISGPDADRLLMLGRRCDRSFKPLPAFATMTTIGATRFSRSLSTSIRIGPGS